MPMIAETGERPTAYEQELKINRPGTPHGADGHTGFRCGECALESPEVVKAVPSSADYWQDKQIAWQEQIDILMREFDVDMSDHLPNHLPVNCTTCPRPKALPTKPLPPQERHHAEEYIPDDQ